MCIVIAEALRWEQRLLRDRSCFRRCRYATSVVMLCICSLESTYMILGAQCLHLRWVLARMIFADMDLSQPSQVPINPAVQRQRPAQTVDCPSTNDVLPITKMKITTAFTQTRQLYHCVLVLPESCLHEYIWQQPSSGRLPAGGDKADKHNVVAAYKHLLQRAPPHILLPAPPHAASFARLAAPGRS